MSETTNSGKDETREVAERPFEYRVEPAKPQRPPGDAGTWIKKGP